MVSAQVIGYGAVIVWCSAAGNFELNAMMPVMAFDLLDAIELLAAGTRTFAEKLVDGLEADRQRTEGSVEQSLAMDTALTGEIGYERTALLANEAHATGRTIRELAREQSGIPEEHLSTLARSAISSRLLRPLTAVDSSDLPRL